MHIFTGRRRAIAGLFLAAALGGCVLPSSWAFQDRPAVERVETPSEPPGCVDAGRPAWVVVRTGDTLGGIAHRLYGHSAYAAELAQLNRDQAPNPNLIFPGQILRLPQSCSQATATALQRRQFSSPADRQWELRPRLVSIADYRR